MFRAKIGWWWWRHVQRPSKGNTLLRDLRPRIPPLLLAWVRHRSASRLLCGMSTVSCWGRCPAADRQSINDLISLLAIGLFSRRQPLPISAISGMESPRKSRSSTVRPSAQESLQYKSPNLLDPAGPAASPLMPLRFAGTRPNFELF